MQKDQFQWAKYLNTRLETPHWGRSIAEILLTLAARKTEAKLARGVTPSFKAFCRKTEVKLSRGQRELASRKEKV